MHFPDFSIASYPEYAVESAGGASYPVYPAINDEPNQAGTTFTGYGNLVLGQSVVDKYGNLFLYVRARGALAEGQVVTLCDLLTGAVQAPAGAADNVSRINTNITTPALNSEIGNLLSFSNTTGPVQIVKKIKGNGSGANAYFDIALEQIFQGRGSLDADAFSAAVATGTVLNVVRLYNVEAAGADTVAMGVAMGTVTDGYKTLIQIAGTARVKGVAATAFTDKALVYTAAAGEIALTGIEEALVGLSRSSYAGANSTLVPVQLTGVSANW